MEELNLTGKVCLIAGAARGIGEKIAETFSNNGSDLAILDINKDKGKELEKRLNRNKSNNKCIFYCCDVTIYNEVKDICREILNEFGKIDVLVYCIGWSINSPLNEMKVEIWKKAIDINLNGAFYLLHCIINSMLANKRGNIILIGSSTTVTGSGGGVHYSSSKAGLMGLMKGLSYEFLTKGIRANIITPALIDTPLLRERYPDTEEVNRMLAAQMPVGRIGKPEDISNIALFLASDKSEYICGTEIIADGGRCLYRHPV